MSRRRKKKKNSARWVWRAERPYGLLVVVLILLPLGGAGLLRRDPLAITGGVAALLVATYFLYRVCRDSEEIRFASRGEKQRFEAKLREFDAAAPGRLRWGDRPSPSKPRPS